MEFPLPPLAEQAEIVRRARISLDLIGSLEAIFAASKSALTQLDQSTLAKAFRGELVPQDPRDEPSAVLLERIRAECEAAAANGAPKRNRRKRRSVPKR